MGHEELHKHNEAGQLQSRDEATLEKYQAEFSYAAYVAFQETCEAVRNLMGTVMNYRTDV